MKISVVIAAYNEARNIGSLTERLSRTLDAMPGVLWELIYVIEGADGTVEIAQGYAEARPQIRILYQPEPAGLGRAFRRGFEAVAADSDLVVTMDADLNHQPEEIPRLIGAVQARDADVVIGSRHVAGGRVEGAPAWKRLLSGAVNRLMRRLMKLAVADQTSGFRVYRAEVLRRIDYRNDGFAFLPEILFQVHQLGYRIVEEPILFTVRTEGRSKMSVLPTAASYVSLFGSRFRRGGSKTVDDAARGADDASRGADDAARGADDATRGADDATRGADDASRGR